MPNLIKLQSLFVPRFQGFRSVKVNVLKMAQQATAKQLQALNDKKLAMPLDTFYEQYVMLKAGERKHRINTRKMRIPLEKYYTSFVLPKQQKFQRKQKIYNLYNQTHYFGPSYLQQRQPRQPESAVQETKNEPTKQAPDDDSKGAETFRNLL